VKLNYIGGGVGGKRLMGGTSREWASLYSLVTKHGGGGLSPLILLSELLEAGDYCIYPELVKLLNLLS